MSIMDANKLASTGCFRCGSTETKLKPIYRLNRRWTIKLCVRMKACKKRHKKAFDKQRREFNARQAAFRRERVEKVMEEA